MGVISQLEDGHFYLEDLTAAVEIDLSNAISFSKIICYNLIPKRKQNFGCVEPGCYSIPKGCLFISYYVLDLMPLHKRHTSLSFSDFFSTQMI